MYNQYRFHAPIPSNRLRWTRPWHWRSRFVPGGPVWFLWSIATNTLGSFPRSIQCSKTLVGLAQNCHRGSLCLGRCVATRLWRCLRQRTEQENGYSLDPDITMIVENDSCWKWFLLPMIGSVYIEFQHENFCDLPFAPSQQVLREDNTLQNFNTLQNLPLSNPYVLVTTNPQPFSNARRHKAAVPENQSNRKKGEYWSYSSLYLHMQ